MKKSNSFMRGANVIVKNTFIPNEDPIEATVLSYDPENDIYTVQHYNGYIESLKSDQIKGRCNQ